MRSIEIQFQLDDSTCMYVFRKTYDTAKVYRSDQQTNTPEVTKLLNRLNRFPTSKNSFNWIKSIPSGMVLGIHHLLQLCLTEGYWLSIGLK